MPAPAPLPFNREHIRPGDRVCVAVSGGADSVALLLALHEANSAARDSLGIGLSAVHVHHGIREAAESDAERVARRSVGFVQGEQERDGIGASGDCDTDAVAGTKVFAVEGKWCGRRHRVIHVNGLRAC